MESLSDNARAIVKFLQENPNICLSGTEIANALGIQPRVANGTITSLVSKGYATRVPATVNGKTVKHVQLTDTGRTLQ